MSNKFEVYRPFQSNDDEINRRLQSIKAGGLMQNQFEMRVPNSLNRDLQIRSQTPNV